MKTTAIAPLNRAHVEKYKGYFIYILPGVDVLTNVAPWQVLEEETDFVLTLHDLEEEEVDANLWYMTSVTDESFPAPLGELCSNHLMFDSAAVKAHFEAEGPPRPDADIRDQLLVKLGREPEADDYLNEHVWQLFNYYRDYAGGFAPWLMIWVKVVTPKNTTALNLSGAYRQIPPERFDEIWQAAQQSVRREIDILVSEN